MNLPNKITVARIALIPLLFVFFFLAYFVDKMWYIGAAAMFAVLCSTDFLDGFIARRTGTVTNLGKFLDPIADKVLVVAAMFMVALLSDGTLTAISYGVAFTLLVGRDFIISGFRLIAVEAKVVIAADIWGKLKTVTLNLALVLLLLSPFHVYVLYAGLALLYAAVIVSVGSGINYVLKNKQVLK